MACGFLTVPYLCLTFFHSCCVTRLFRASSGFSSLSDPREWSQNAVKLKMALMISPNEYRIHYCKPGTLFDLSWMRVEDIDGISLTDAEAQNK